MKKVRVIARLDIKNDFVIKGIHLEGLRKIGDPNIIAKEYYNQGVDEIIFMDAVAAYYDRNSLKEIIQNACKEVFVPITVGGGIRTIADIQNALDAGADKTAINTRAVSNPDFIKEASVVFGSQCIVCSIDAKQIGTDKWEVYVDNGREPSGIDVVEWAKRVEDLGAGEILLTSIDKEGTKKGFDINLCNSVADVVKIPVICSGGAGSKEDIAEVIANGNVDAVSLASILHYNLDKIGSIKNYLVEEHGIKTRL